MGALSRKPTPSLAGVRVLIVEDDPFIRGVLERQFTESRAVVRSVGTVREGLEALGDHPDVIVLDVMLPDGTGLTIAEEAGHLHPVPRMIAMSGGASAAQSFRLAQLHVEQYLPKPFGMWELEQAIADAAGWVEELAKVSALCVGAVGLVEARDLVRETMTRQAMAITGGNRGQAARMLGVTRQAVQAVVRTA